MFVSCTSITGLALLLKCLCGSSVKVAILESHSHIFTHDNSRVDTPNLAPDHSLEHHDAHHTPPPPPPPSHLARTQPFQPKLARRAGFPTSPKHHPHDARPTSTLQLPSALKLLPSHAIKISPLDDPSIHPIPSSLPHRTLTLLIYRCTYFYLLRTHAAALEFPTAPPSTTSTTAPAPIMRLLAAHVCVCM
ncbi:hypothetical protein BDU57DRAFT_296119 [Ampelomyces quisqualis]|uniref:Uncharacterized protein n=1 Tax=Ampelomyces quisqualis TaxID=50730 RepID=A0A6A5QKA4_AMPQU|nr:hypothetical protein BDU57DRAFT_296119 [Ampelomyces quisqualis]